MVDRENPEADRLASIRREIAHLARQRGCRSSKWTREIPTEWRPHTVRDAEGEYFTDAGAWDFVANLVESGCRMREVVLRNPTGKVAFAMTVRLQPEAREIYIKVRLGSVQPGSGKTMVIGYSFHYSIYL
jgi:hypothetical protein